MAINSNVYGPESVLAFSSSFSSYTDYINYLSGNYDLDIVINHIVVGNIFLPPAATITFGLGGGWLHQGHTYNLVDQSISNNHNNLMYLSMDNGQLSLVSESQLELVGSGEDTTD